MKRDAVLGAVYGFAVVIVSSFLLCATGCPVIPIKVTTPISLDKYPQCAAVDPHAVKVCDGSTTPEHVLCAVCPVLSCMDRPHGIYCASSAGCDRDPQCSREKVDIVP